MHTAAGGVCSHVHRSDCCRAVSYALVSLCPRTAWAHHASACVQRAAALRCHVMLRCANLEHKICMLRQYEPKHTCRCVEQRAPTCQIFDLGIRRAAVLKTDCVPHLAAQGHPPLLCHPFCDSHSSLDINHTNACHGLLRWGCLFDGSAATARYRA